MLLRGLNLLPLTSEINKMSCAQAEADRCTYCMSMFSCCVITPSCKQNPHSAGYDIKNIYIHIYITKINTSCKLLKLLHRCDQQSDSVAIWEQEQSLISVLKSCSSSGQTPHRGSITERAHCPQARTELPFFKKRQRGIPYVGCCSDEKPFHRAVFQSPLAALITGPGAAL